MQTEVRVMLAGPKVGRAVGESGQLDGDRWTQATWVYSHDGPIGHRMTRGEKRGRGSMGVECTLAVIGTGGPVKRSNLITSHDGPIGRRTRGYVLMMDPSDAPLLRPPPCSRPCAGLHLQAERLLEEACIWPAGGVAQQEQQALAQPGQ
eukprot:1188165-Prorocentrum_minimum.AAC.1